MTGPVPNLSYASAGNYVQPLLNVVLTPAPPEIPVPPVIPPPPKELTYVAFKNTGTRTWTAPAGTTSVRYSLVGAGGAGMGSYYPSGGGGGGQVITGTYSVVPGTSYAITVGAGGVYDAITYRGYPGGNSSFHTVVALGGGGAIGTNDKFDTTQDRSGGRAASGSSASTGGKSAPYQEGLAPPTANAGGGGGSLGNGENGTLTQRGAGGAGTPLSFPIISSGATILYGVGGSGGAGQVTTARDGPDGAENTGNGGGGVSTQKLIVAGSNGGAGGSGLVVIEFYATPPPSIPLNPTLLYLAFTTVGTTTWTAPAAARSVTYWLVGGGGGGGGGSTGGGGGGGGQVVTGSYSVMPGTPYTITVGAGGAPADARNRFGYPGGNSSFSTFTALGGRGASLVAPITFNGVVVTNPYGFGGLAATESSVSQGGFQGVNNGGGGGGGSLGNGGKNRTTQGGAGGAGTPLSFPVVRSGASISYGVGGTGGTLGVSTVTTPVANTGNGGTGGLVLRSIFTAGSGGSGLVVLQVFG